MEQGKRLRLDGTSGTDGTGSVVVTACVVIYLYHGVSKQQQDSNMTIVNILSLSDTTLIIIIIFPERTKGDCPIRLILDTLSTD